MTNPLSTRSLTIGFLATFALAGCSGAASVEGEEVAPETSLSAQQRNTEQACTTTRDDSDANYICYTTECAETTKVECYPKRKVATVKGAVSIRR